ncbi:HupE/UreJ family protein [Duganella vulcania]|uniref:HupE-UreJ family metal transporter n=1 Tax=Duganella vulcania TaxID=2692166 RepID=A0A845GV36_9BURK|nr:HupE/UreJ family protein [Duganella vulcania]MYM98154.1 HupE-UreJ family metal transporter [Duganella vulcania]
MKHKRIAAAAALILVSAVASAHPQGGGAHTHGFFDGFVHPFTGLDHLLAMLAVGMWSARQSNAQWLPATFLGMMLVGVLTGVAGLAIPGLETGIALTVALMGVLIAVAARLPAALGALMVGVFALLHGNAHGHELPEAASAMGLLAASALLVYGGRMLGRISPAMALKLSGAAIAATGVMLVTVA